MAGVDVSDDFADRHGNTSVVYGVPDIDLLKARAEKAERQCAVMRKTLFLVQSVDGLGINAGARQEARQAVCDALRFDAGTWVPRAVLEQARDALIVGVARIESDVEGKRRTEDGDIMRSALASADEALR